MSSNSNARRGVPKKLKISEKVGKSKKPSTSCPSSPDSGRSSPGSSCSICLGRHENKSYTNNCLHEFCFTCLLEWSKVKPECPLCKQAFTSIIHNVRANHEYDEHKIPLVEPEEPDVFDQLLHHRFRYRTTVTSERRRMLALERLHTMRQFAQEGVLPHPTERRPMRSRLTGTSTFRRRVYQRDLWVRPLSDITGRYRETTPEFFQMNPAMTHRLVPWLNRELNVLLVNHENRLSYVLQLILRLITQLHIRSRAFREAIQSYIGAYTEHFIHEFFQFARSPYDMYGFDENADYEPRNNLQHEEVAVSESSEEDVPVTRSFSNEQHRVAPLDIPLPPSPQPGPSGIGRGSSSAAMIDDGQSYSAIPGHSNVARRPSDEDEEDEGDIEIVEVVRPSSPVVITLSESEEDREEDAERNEASSTSSRGKALKQSSRPRRDQQQRTKSKKKKRRRERSSSRSPEQLQSTRGRFRRETEENNNDNEELPTSQISGGVVRYWDMDPEEIRHRLRNAGEFNSEPSASGSRRRHKRGRND
ncbi:E3 ubiquitin-protein ligase Topors-like isoform X2 [Daphnia carinata]|uniref:E3 ubiquitin-protein ligase Topors-like isoform X2 n=1 Tax=Daphnia carinata TaxID=120202 RepID=UPI0025811021|nr:E3 ubiquitin-protein ligase Topors-like isoform X2 [Daphnia carinata]